MVADELALDLAANLVTKESRVLDPFCGAGRLVMAAAAQGADCTAFDRNPLACLITKAKSVRVSIDTVHGLIEDIPAARRNLRGTPLVFREHRKVDWFSPTVLSELAAIVSWLNRQQLCRSERTVVAAALSATTRQASYCRKDGWKLHRISEERRRAFSSSAWDVLAAKLKEYVESAARIPLPRSTINVALKDARTLSTVRSPSGRHVFDVVMTSPPYGDSRTTIQYGAASALCLDVVSRLNGMEDLFQKGHAIDDACLGGREAKGKDERLMHEEEVRAYWAGSGRSEGFARVARFLGDLRTVCRGISRVSADNASVVMIVGRRSVGGFRLKLDEFLADELKAHGFALMKRTRRPISDKRMPRRINRFGASKEKSAQARGSTLTMLDEHILTLGRGKGNPHTAF